MNISTRTKVIIACIILFVLLIAVYFWGFTGILVIDILPAGATVEIDGKVVGDSPIRKRVFVGTHRIKVIKGGYGPLIIRGIQIERGKKVEISRKLPSLIRSNPPGAEVYIDGEYKGKTPLPFEFQMGYHRVLLKKPKYVDVAKRFFIADMVMKPMPVFDLTPAETVYPVSISSQPPGAIIYIEGSRRGETPKQLELPADRYSIRIFKEGYHEITDELIIPDMKEYATVLKPIIFYGSISVNVQPFATVYLDGRKIGETPIELEKVPVGIHTIRLTRPGFVDIKRKIKIEKNEKYKIGIKADEWLLEW
ncbi:MAG: PEGA domain-containing protein [Candidatus Poribacteria bacterium]